MTSQELIRFSALSEPGDGLAGGLLRQFGAETILAHFKSGQAFSKWSAWLASERPEYLGRLPELIERFRLRWPQSEPQQQVRAASKVGAKPISAETHPELWQRFDALGDHRPHLLWIRGEADLSEAAVSIVGTRAATSYGLEITQEVVARTGDLSIVSGGARGIDAQAHRTAIQLERPTIAYLAGGIDRPYPREHSKLFSEIVVSGGATLAESAPGTEPTRWRFLQRNRLIAAHSIATVVIEAGLQSGAKNTASRAIECGRKVFAVPGPVTSSASAYCNQMIAENTARSIHDLQAFSRLFDPGAAAVLDLPQPSLSSDQVRALDALGSRFRSLDKIAASSGLGVIHCRIELDRLEDMGLVQASANGWRRRQLGLS